jgi:hypothetical protein
LPTGKFLENLLLRPRRTQGGRKRIRHGFTLIHTAKYLCHRGHREHRDRIEVRHGFTLIHTAGRELLAEDGGQTMEDGRQKQRGKSKKPVPRFPNPMPGRTSEVSRGANHVFQQH